MLEVWDLIKIGKHVYIHFTTLLLFAVCYFNRNLEMLFINYIAITMHELVHLITAVSVGLTPSYICFLPFGVNLKLKNSILYSIWDEIILYASGPLFNIILALCLLPFCKNGTYFRQFYLCNLGLFIFNMLPILPMDGAVILKKLLQRRWGAERANLFLKTVSGVLLAVLIYVEIKMLIYNRFNYPFLFVIIFLTANIFTNKEKYFTDFVKELMFYKQKNDFKIKKAKVLSVKTDTDYKLIAKKFTQGCNYIIFKENREGKIESIVSEREIIEKILNSI